MLCRQVQRGPAPPVVSLEARRPRVGVGTGLQQGPHHRWRTVLGGMVEGRVFAVVTLVHIHSGLQQDGDNGGVAGEGDDVEERYSHRGQPIDLGSQVPPGRHAACHDIGGGQREEGAGAPALAGDRIGRVSRTVLGGGICPQPQQSARRCGVAMPLRDVQRGSAIVVACVEVRAGRCQQGQQGA